MKQFLFDIFQKMYGGGYPGPNCFRPIAITYNGKTANAVIMDEVNRSLLA